MSKSQDAISSHWLSLQVARQTGSWGVLYRTKFHETAAQHIRRQLQLLKAELPLPPENDDALASMAAAGFGSHVLEDDQCEDEEAEPSSATLSQIHKLLFRQLLPQHCSSDLIAAPLMLVLTVSSLLEYCNFIFLYGIVLHHLVAGRIRQCLPAAVHTTVTAETRIFLDWR